MWFSKDQVWSATVIIKKQEQNRNEKTVNHKSCNACLKAPESKSLVSCLLGTLTVYPVNTN